jgi:hypothetical protein
MTSFKSYVLGKSEDIQVAHLSAKVGSTLRLCRRAGPQVL